MSSEEHQVEHIRRDVRRCVISLCIFVTVSEKRMDVKVEEE